jgi:ubiquinone/menaquinone biosynthesis C-methylase UbiE/DNA-binding transcriptional ArsR family regulator
MSGNLTAEHVVGALKAAAEPTRLRILMLLAGSELSVKDLTRILGQSQPRISRHLKLLHEAQLIERSRAGSWVYFTLGSKVGGSKAGDSHAESASLARMLVAQVSADDGPIARDAERADALRIERESAAQAYFAHHAAEWDRIRSLYVDELEVEAAMLDAVGTNRYDLLVDLGTGTGRMLELFSAHYERGLGIDVNHAMLAYARSKIERIGQGRANVRQGDLYNLALADGSAGAVVMHQVLHFLTDPARAIKEAARVLAPGGDLLIVDFAPHELEFLRERFAHDRLGFSAANIAGWLREAGLDPVGVRDLAPPSGLDGEKLTVSLWLARRRSSGTAARVKSSGFSRLEIAE